MKVSIITLTYNNYEQLLTTLKSFEELQNTEVVIINGGDCSQTKAFLETCSYKSITESDRGIADGFNKGVAHSSGEYLIFINSGDSLLDSSYLQRAAEYLDKNPTIDFVHGSIVYQEQLAGNLKQDPPCSDPSNGMPYFHQTMVARRSLFENYGKFKIDYRSAMDYEWVCRIHAQGAQGYYLGVKPVIQMEGQGISISNEKLSLNESRQALIENGLFTLKGRLGYTKRVLKYYIREALKFLGLQGLLIKIKRSKHEALT